MFLIKKVPYIELSCMYVKLNASTWMENLEKSSTISTATQKLQKVRNQINKENKNKEIK